MLISPSNDLISRDGRLTGEIKVNVSLTEKMSLVKRMATIFNLQCKQIALVGDRSNDLTIPECLQDRDCHPKDRNTIRNAYFVIHHRRNSTFEIQHEPGFNHLKGTPYTVGHQLLQFNIRLAGHYGGYW